jgi:excisionase family DNA binding protein
MEIQRDTQGNNAKQDKLLSGEYLSESEAAHELGISRITLFRARHAGRISCYRIGSRVVYSRQHLADFLRACEERRTGKGVNSDAA